MEATLARSVTPTQAKKTSARLIDWLLIVVLCLAVVKTNWRLEQLVDLDGTDETNYLSLGANWSKEGRPNPRTEIWFAPLYSLWYRALSHLQSDPARVPSLNFRILTALLVGGLYILLRRSKVPALPSAIAAFFLLTHELSLDPPTRSIHFAVLMLAAGMWAALSLEGFIRQSCALAVGATLAAFSRPEYAFLALMMFALTGLFICYKRFRLARSETWAVGISLGAAIALVIIFGPPVGGGNDRSFYAFSQHFSLNYGLRHPSEIDPWWEPEIIVEQVFGGSKTLLQAARNNPHEFFTHISYNLTSFFKRFVPLGFAHRNFLLPGGRRLEFVENCLLGITLLGMAAFRFKRLRANLRTFVFSYSAIGLFIIGVFGVVAAGMILTSTADRYFYPYVFLGLFIIFFLLGRSEENSEQPMMLPSAGILCLAILGAAPASPYMENRCTPIRSAVTALSTFDFNPGTGYVEAIGTRRIEIYLSKNLKYVHPLTKTQPFPEFLRANNIGAIHVSPYLRTARNFAHDPDWIDFLNQPAKYGFKVVSLPCDESLYVREAALAGPHSKS